MMKTIEDINLNQWFMNRELSFVPNHFVRATTPVTSESKAWIIEKLRGRYSYFYTVNSTFGDAIPAFEDPKEVVIYELTWG